MKDYYQDIITEKSWRLLQSFKKEVDFILIGGWAVYLYTQGLKSKDIDIIINYQELGKLKTKYNVVKNDRLNKYEIKKEEIDIDIYLPFYSNLGIPVEEIIKETTNVHGFILPKKEILLLTKITAFENRKASIKGQKDLIDIISLVFLEDFDFEYFFSFIKKHNIYNYPKILEELLVNTSEVEELELNRHSFAKKKKKLLKQVQSFQGTR